MNNDEPTQTTRLDKIAIRARITLIVGFVLLAAWITYSAITGLAWLPWLLARSWLVTLVIIVIVFVGALLFSLARPKNIAWRLLCEQFGQEFGETLDRKNFGTGRGQVGDYAYFGIRCFGTPSGLEVSRIVSAVNPPLYIPWSAVAKIDTFPNLLTGRKDFETDMQAQIALRDLPDLTIEVPWLTEYRQLLPKSVKYRAIKLSKKE